MVEPRPAASLTSNLLARRGDARPAMRRQGMGGVQLASVDLDDLGWNDIGHPHEVTPPPATSLAAMTPPEGVASSQEAAHPSVQAVPHTAPTPADAAAPQADGGQSPISRQLDAIAERIQSPVRETNFKPLLARNAPSGETPAADSRSAARKAAFTLRLEADRHLRLRLLSAVTRRSAQQLLVEALDSLLADNEKVEELAQNVEVNDDSSSTEASLKRQE